VQAVNGGSRDEMKRTTDLVLKAIGWRRDQDG
jgi:hypothetical protein